MSEGKSTAAIDEHGSDLPGHEKGPPSTENSVKEPVPHSGKDEDEPAEEYLSGFKLNTIIAGLCLSVFLVGLDQAILATAVPTITTEFNSLDDIGWYGSAFLFTTCALQPMAGKTYKFFPLKWAYLSYLAIFEVGSLLCAVSRSSTMLIVGRAVGGIGATGLFSGALVIIAHLIAPRLRAVYTGGIASMFAISAIVGPLLGGALTEHATWRWCFYINLPCGAVTALVLFLLFPRQDRPGSGMTSLEKLHQLDLPGMVLFIPAVIILLMAVQWGGVRYAWNSATVIGMLCGSMGLLILFAIWQWHQQESATIPPKIFLQRTVLSTSVASFLGLGGAQVCNYFLPIWFQVIQGVSPTQSGIRILPGILSNLVISILSGALVSLYGYFTPFIIFGCACAAVAGGLLSTFKTDTGSAAWIGYQIFFGIGSSCLVQMPVIAIMAVLPKEEVSVGTTLILFFQFFGGALFLAVGQSVFDTQLVKALVINAPSIDPQMIVKIGAAGVRTAVSPGDLLSVLISYNSAITTTFYVAAATGAIAFMASLGVEWKSVKGKDLTMGAV